MESNATVMNLQTTFTLGPYLPPPVTTATFPARASGRKGDDDAVGASVMVKLLGLGQASKGMARERSRQPTLFTSLSVVARRVSKYLFNFRSSSFWREIKSISPSTCQLFLAGSSDAEVDRRA